MDMMMEKKISSFSLSDDLETTIFLRKLALFVIFLSPLLLTLRMILLSLVI